MAAEIQELLRFNYPHLFMTSREQLHHKGLLSEENKWTFLKPFPHPFHTAFYGEGASPSTLMELGMIRLSAKIRSKSEWKEKRKDPAVVKKWKADADEIGLTEAQFKFVIAELDFYASLKNGPMEPSVVGGVWLADRLFRKELMDSFIQEVATLENVPESQKDWKTGSDKQVLNLVDPSLFCVVFRLTKQVEENETSCLDHVGGGQVIPPPPNPYLKYNLKYDIDPPYFVSMKYQWLPTDFCVSSTGDVKIKSYINNLHPTWHANMYKVLGEVFKGILPPLTKTLSYIVEGHPRRIFVDPYHWYTEPPERPEYDSNGKEIDYEIDEGVELVLPDTPVFETLERPSYDSVNLSGKNLQVVVEMKNIVLTPDNPVYSGKSWHIHGMQNEQIVATAIWYYEWENISESEMHFRNGIREPLCQEYDYNGVRRVYGLVDGDLLNQYLGAVVIRRDRCVTFHNISQHRVDPFQLEDKTKSGHCKMLSFFLVDPAVHVLSTSNVPPQQKSWYIARLQEIEPFNRLPLEVLLRIVDYLQWPMSLEDAKLYREKMEEERKAFTAASTKNYFERCYSPR